MKSYQGLLILVVLLTMVGAAVAEREKKKLPANVIAILDAADRVELLSLDPSPEKGKVKGNFHGWLVLGKTVIEQAETRKQILKAVVKGVAESKFSATCFKPRHGIRVNTAGKSVDFVICFECMWLDFYVGDDTKRTRLITSQMPQPVLDKVLKEAKVPLPKAGQSEN